MELHGKFLICASPNLLWSLRFLTHSPFTVVRRILLVIFEGSEEAKLDDGWRDNSVVDKGQEVLRLPG